MVMAGLGLGSTPAAVMLGKATGRYEQGANDRAILHGRRHRWTARALLFGGLTLGLVLLAGVFSPSVIVFGLLWILNGAGQALIAISSSTLLAEHTVA
jgi:NRE family putative nickel resistance protein-like MFS transporter